MTPEQKKELVTAGVLISALISAFPTLDHFALTISAIVNVYWCWEI